jgi:FixJ family two-component response regulator
MGSRPVLHVIGSDQALPGSDQSLARRIGCEVRFYRSADQFLADQPIERPCCLIAGPLFDGGRGEALQTRLLELGQPVPIIFTADDCDFELVVRVLQRGAISVLRRPVDRDELERLIRSAIRADQTHADMEALHREFLDALACLTKRQRQVLEHVTDGMPTKAISRSLGVSNRLVEMERSELLRVFQVQSTPGLTLKIGQFRILAKLLSPECETRPTLRSPAPRINSPATHRMPCRSPKPLRARVYQQDK